MNPPFLFALLSLMFAAHTASLAQEPIPLPGEESPEGSRHKLEWEFGGYLENTLSGEYLRSESRVRPTNAARGKLNLSGRFHSIFDFGVSTVGIGYSGRTRIDTAQYFPSSLEQALPAANPEPAFPGVRELFTYQLDSRVYLQEAFATVYLPHFRIRAGRHKFYSGTGYAFNPIDLFNRKDPLDPTYEIDGLDALWGALELPHQTELQLVARFTHHLSHRDYQMRLKTYARGWDLGVQYTRNLRERVDWEALIEPEATAAGALPGSFDALVHGFRWNLVGGEFAGELAGLGIHGEGGYVWVEAPNITGGLVGATRNHERLLAGLDYTFDSQLYLLIEYMRLGQGAGRDDPITLNDRMAYLTGETLAIGKNTLFSRLSYPLTDFIEIALNSITNADDPSVIVNPWLLWDVHPRLKLSFTLYVPCGEEESQLGNSGPGGFVRLRFHF